MTKATGLDHLRDEVLTTMHHAHHVDIHDPSAVGQVAFEKLAEVADAGVVDQYIESAQGGVNMAGKRLHRAFTRHLKRMGHVGSTQGFNLNENAIPGFNHSTS